jgi:OHCU decarboxylase
VTITLEQLNLLHELQAERRLLVCCGSKAWARGVTAGRPYYEFGELLTTSDRVWARLTPDDWREAFSHHPRIGERASITRTTTAERWSEREQARARETSDALLDELAEVNAEYEDRFGYVFLICATAKTADQILESARARLHNDPETELRVAAEEQRRITHLRLRKLLDI